MKQLLIIILFPAICFSQKVINVNLYGTARMDNIAWNDWNVLSSLRSSVFKYSDGTLSTVTSSLSNQTNYADNGPSYVVTMCPQQVARDCSYEAGQRQDTIKGLSLEFLYDLAIYSSRNNPGHIGRFTVAGIQKDVAAYQNNTPLIYQDLKPVNGQIIIYITQASGQYNYLNGFTLTEKSARKPLIVNAGQDTVIVNQVDKNFTDTLKLNGFVSGDGVVFEWYKKTPLGLPDSILNKKDLRAKVIGMATYVHTFVLKGTDKWGEVKEDEVNITIQTNPKSTFARLLFDGTWIFEGSRLKGFDDE